MKQLLSYLFAFSILACSSADHTTERPKRPTDSDLRGKDFTVQLAESEGKDKDQHIELTFRRDTTGQMFITEQSSFIRKPFSWRILQDSILILRIPQEYEGKVDDPVIWNFVASWEGERILLKDKNKNKDAMLLTLKAPK